MIVALTGGTGFVGRRLIALAVEAGHEVRALTRRRQAAEPGVSWIEGALDNPAALATLVDGADAVIHVAGVVRAPDRAGFTVGNIDGTRAIVAAALGAGVDRFVHVSSLAARAPALSDYGWSKAESEQLVCSAALPSAVIVRPPAVYGPGDLEMLDTFRVARWGVAFTPPAGRMAVIHVDDLARLLLALAADAAYGGVLEPDDGTPGGWSHADFLGHAIGKAVGKRVTPIALPRPLLSLAARIDGALRGADARLTPDRVGYMCHPDWTVDPLRRPDPALWQPQIPTRDGLAETVAWYRAQELL
ncbi:MAG: epimerase [Sphingomonas sp. 28-66-16]|nr:MAG: epimerase [Sphingomonas sp. 28-66-16]